MFGDQPDEGKLVERFEMSVYAFDAKKDVSEAALVVATNYT